MKLKEELEIFFKEHLKEKTGHIGRCKFRATMKTFDIGRLKYVPLLCIKCDRLGKKWIKIDLELQKQRFRAEFSIKPIVMKDPKTVLFPIILDKKYLNLGASAIS